MSWFLVFIAFALVFALLGFGLRFVENLEDENRAMEARLHAARMYDEALNERMDKVRRFRHDVNGLLQAVEFSQYLHSRGVQVDGDVDDSGAARDAEAEATGRDPVEGASALVGAVIDLKRQQCAEAQAAFSCEIDRGFYEQVEALEVAEADVCAVVQNLLENAYEASLAVQPMSDRFVMVRMGLDVSVGNEANACTGTCGSVRIEVSNRTACDEMPTFRTTKEDAHAHGIGLQVVREIAERRGGSVVPVFDADTRVLTMSVELGEG